jgi:hypothetical protein
VTIFDAMRFVAFAFARATTRPMRQSGIAALPDLPSTIKIDLNQDSVARLDEN